MHKITTKTCWIAAQACPPYESTTGQALHDLSREPHRDDGYIDRIVMHKITTKICWIAAKTHTAMTAILTGL